MCMPAHTRHCVCTCSCHEGCCGRLAVGVGGLVFVVNLSHETCKGTTYSA